MTKKIEIRLGQSTPALIGYTSPSRIDTSLYLRPSSLKGIWRWTLRALVGGIMYENCRLQGVPGDKASAGGVYKLPSTKEAKLLSRIVGKRLGMGYVGGEESIASSYRLRVHIERAPRRNWASNGYIAGRRMQRIVLQTLGGRRVEYFEDGIFKLTIDVVRSLSTNEIELAVRGLILALTVMGVGKGSRRGLGSFDVLSIRSSVAPHLEIYERDPIRFIEETRKLAEEIVTKELGTRNESCRIDSLPPMPVFSKAKVSGFYVAQMLRTELPWTDVHEFFVRPQRCRRLYNSSICYDTLRRKASAWILGLPRGRRGAVGYYPSKDTELNRRASPILMSYHSERHLLGKGVFITMITSADWPKVVEWMRGRKKIRIRETTIVDAMRTAYDELLQYLRNRVVRIWPAG